MSPTSERRSIGDWPLPTLDMQDQLALQARAIRILARAEVQAERKAVAELFRGSPLARTPDGAATLERAADRFALAAIEDAIVDDSARPMLMWVNTQPTDWHGVAWPGTCWGAHNPDNMSRAAVVDGQSTYEISGVRKGAGPSQETFLLNGEIAGTGAQSNEGAPVLASLRSDELVVDPDGSFLITIGPEPGEPGRNHLQSRPNAKVLRVRDTMSDWTSEYPSRLRIRRVSGPPAKPARTDETIAAEVVSLLKLQPAYWLKYYADTVFAWPKNTVRYLGGRAGGWGFLSIGWFELAEDEALVITMDPLGADYAAIQVTDPWTVPPDYINRTAGLNRAQAKANADGSLSWVISPRDPGVWNWLDTEDLHLGTYTIRWQGVAHTGVESAEQAILGCEVMQLSELKARLPSETVWIDGATRAKQQADRAAAFALRLAN